MRMGTIGVGMGCAALLAACTSWAGQAGQAVASVRSPAPYVDSPATIPAAFQVVTSSPAVRMKVGARSLVLVDGHAARSLTIDTNDAVFDGRYAQASDARGRVEVRVTPVRCHLQGHADDYPYTARVMIDDGGAITGCGTPLP